MNTSTIEKKSTAVVEAIIRFFAWTPNWLLIVIGLAFWPVAVIMFLTERSGTSPFLYFGLGMSSAFICAACGIALIIKTAPTKN